jgi:hypothetical protein
MRSTYDTHEIVWQTLHTVIHLYIRYGNFNGITGRIDLETISPDLQCVVGKKVRFPQAPEWAIPNPTSLGHF